MASLTLTVRRGKNRVEVPIRLQDGSERLLWYELIGGPGARLRPLDAGFAITALLPYAMHHGLDVTTTQAVPLATLRNLEEWQDAWVRLRGDLYRRVRIDAPVARTARVPWRRPASAALAFSGGMDATHTLAAHSAGAFGLRSVRIGRGVFVHGFDIPLSHDGAFDEALRSAARITESFAVPLSAVRTNWRDFSPHWESTFMVGLSSCLALFASDHAEALASSGGPYGSETLGWGSHSSTDRLLGTTNYPLTVSGLGWSRTEKARFLAGFESVLTDVRVCWEGPLTGRNCGTCEKCLRTRLQFLAHGVANVGGFDAPTPAEVASIRVRNQVQLKILVDLVKSPGTLPGAHLDALRRVVDHESARLSALEDAPA